MCEKNGMLERLERVCDKINACAEICSNSSCSSSSSYSSLLLDDVRERLFSFSRSKWSVKPKEISLRALAQHGWCYLGDDVVQCISCKRYMNVLLPSIDKVDISVFNAAVRKINEQMVKGHESTCAMRNRGTELIVPFSRTFYREKIAKRYETMKDLNLDDVSIVELNGEFSGRLSELRLVNCKAAVLACCGWHKNEAVDDTILCDYCERTVGLWLFRNKRKLNSENEHHRWCGYVEVLRDGSVVWEQHLSAAVEYVRRKRKLPAIFEMAEKIRCINNAIAPCILQQLPSAELGK